MFPNGVSAYVDLMQDLIPEMKDGTIRTAIDTGCGVGSTFNSILWFLIIFAFRGNFNCLLQKKILASIDYFPWSPKDHILNFIKERHKKF